MSLSVTVNILPPVCTGVGIAAASSFLGIVRYLNPILQALQDTRDPSKALVPITHQLAQYGIQKHPYIAAAVVAGAAAGATYAVIKVLTDPVNTVINASETVRRHPVLASWAICATLATIGTYKQNPDFLKNVAVGALVQAGVLIFPPKK